MFSLLLLGCSGTLNRGYSITKGKNMFIAKNNLNGRTAPGGELEAQLDRVETLISKLGTGVKHPEEILDLMDQMAGQFSELARQGASVQAATAQYEACSAALRAAAGSFLKEMGGAGALQAARRQRNPDGEAWWWYLDDYLTQQRQTWLRRTLKKTLIMVVVLVVLGIVYQLFFAPDPKIMAVYNASANADRLAGQGKVEEALVEVETGLAVVPDSQDLWIRKGVLLGLLGKDAQAADSFAQGKLQSKNDEEFYLVRSQVYLAIGLYDQALADGQTAVAANPNSAIGYMLVGTTQELLGKLREAYITYQKAEELSGQLGDAGMTAQIKVKMAYLLQRFSSPVFETPVP
jgi:tetratricopeptide (TPR) repeat protein